MGLKVELKAGERFILGDCLVTNGNQRTRLLIEGNTPTPAPRNLLHSDARSGAGGTKRVATCRGGEQSHPRRRNVQGA